MIVRWPASHLCAFVLISTPAIVIAEETAEGFHETFEFSDQSGGGYGGSGPAGGDGTELGQFVQIGESGGGGRSLARSGVVHFALPTAPLVIVTQPMPSQTELEWAEDLKVMDKLLHDAVTRDSGDARPPQAMGIRMRMMGGKVEPMYIEGCGVVFGFSVNVTLAAGSDDPVESVKSSGDAESTWERAKRDLNSEAAGPAGGLPPGFPGGAFPRAQPRKFRPAVLEKLVDATLKVLPQAKNLRHLSDDEVVFVTVARVDDAGAPVRPSLKAKKSDVDKAADGSLSPEDFNARVARRVR